MNERMTRVGGNHVADFLTAFSDNSRPGLGKKPNPGDSDAVWLVWRLEGKNTLWDLMLVSGTFLAVAPQLHKKLFVSVSAYHSHSLQVISKVNGRLSGKVVAKQAIPMSSCKA